ncbi:TELO2-interacting protein 1 homolog isoform X2 [Lethenteron reissneri]|nr:TELO2-interacting protein 1 homolog isoform X2 [Lethenteron reissneri]
MLASPGAMGDFTGINTGDPSSSSGTSVAKPTAASPSACSGGDADANSPGPSFAALRPFCVAVTRFPSRDTLRSLAGALSRVPDPHLRRLLDYVLFAPRHALRRADAAQRGVGPSSSSSSALDAALEHLRVAAAECMSAVLARAPVSDGRLLGELLTELCALCDDRGNGGGGGGNSEEVKLAALTALAALLRCAEPAAAAALYDDDDDDARPRRTGAALARLGHAVSTLLAVAEGEGERALRLLALECLAALWLLPRRDAAHGPPRLPPRSPSRRGPAGETRAKGGGVRVLFSRLAVGGEEEVEEEVEEVVEEVVEKEKEEEEVEEEEEEGNAIATRKAFDSLASFLPGTATALCRIVTTCGGRAATQPGAVAALATRLLAHAVARAAPDDLLTPDPREPDQAVQAVAARGDEGGGAPPSLLVRRTPDWARATGERLAPLLLRLGPVAAGHRAWRVRLEAAALAGRLLRRCRRVLGADAVAAMLDVVVGLSCDEDQRVRSASFSVLRRRRRSLLGTAPGDDRAVEESALERAFSLCSSLPRLARSATAADDLKLATLSRLLGYLRLLGPRVSALLRSAPHLSRLARALVQLLAPDTSQQVVVEEGEVEEEEGRGGERGDGDEAAAAIASPEPPPAGDADVGGHFAARGGVAAGGRAHWPLAGSAPSDWPIPGGRRKRFRGFSDERVHATLQQICRTLGFFGDLYLLVDTFLEMYRESRLQRAPAAMILNEVIVGAAGRGLDPWAYSSARSLPTAPSEEAPGDWRSRYSQEELFWLARAVVEEYTSPANWRLPTARLGNSAVPGDAGTGAMSLVVPLAPAVEGECTLEAFNGNAWQLSAQLEGIAGFAGVLGLDFRPMLAIVLYPVLEKVGGDGLDTQPVCCTARRVTRHVARACGYARPGLLVSHNSDYVASAVTIALRHLGESESAPLVLAAVLRYGEGPDAVLQAAGSAQELLSLVDRHPATLARSAAPALLALACALDKWFPGPHTAASERRRSGDGDAGARPRGPQGPPGPPGPRGEEGRSPCSPEEVAEFVRDHHRQTQLAAGNVGSEEEVDADDDDTAGAELGAGLGEGTEKEEELKEKGEELKEEEEDAGYDKKPALPPQLELCGALLERSVHLLSHHDVAVRLTMLEVVRLAMGVLSAREDSCLPMAHRLWPALVQRLTGDEWRVILAAFKTLVSLSRVCGDFLRRRVSGELLGPVAASLAARAPVSAAAGAEGRRRGGPGGPPLYPRSLACRLQAAALDSLGPLAVVLRLDNADLDTVVTAALPYLSCHQPMVLQEAAMGLLRSVMAVDPDRVWLSLCQLHCPHDLQSPGEGFRPVQFARSASTSSTSSTSTSSTSSTSSSSAPSSSSSTSSSSAPSSAPSSSTSTSSSPSSSTPSSSSSSTSSSSAPSSAPSSSTSSSSTSSSSAPSSAPSSSTSSSSEGAEFAGNVRSLLALVDDEPS